MEKRLQGKAAIVIGAGQTPGETIGNGRAISLLFARAGAKVLLVDNRLESARETQSTIIQEGGESLAFAADVTRAEATGSWPRRSVEVLGKIDILVNVVGIGGGDFGPVELSEELWEKVLRVNLKSMYLSCKHVLPYMEKRGSGSIVNISSVMRQLCHNPFLSMGYQGGSECSDYSSMKYASKGIRVTDHASVVSEYSLAIRDIATRRGIRKEELVKERDSMVPLKGGMGTGWDTAYAALFLASEEAKFITAVILPVDGGQSAKIG